MNVVDTKLADNVPVTLKSPVTKELPVISVGLCNNIFPAPFVSTIRLPFPLFEIVKSLPPL
jgi:hypothetical protein